MNNKEQVSAIKRYKIGYHTDEWGVRSTTPGGIPDPAGSWVRHEDHLAALLAAPQPSPTPQADSAKEAPNAMQSLTAALKGDPEYAWAWHCNLAMPIMDNAKVSPRVANITAARLMQHLFGIDTEKHPHFEVADEAPQADSMLEDAARYRWLREGNDAKHGAAWHVAVNLYGCEWDAAIDAARKQGGNHE